MSAADVDTMVVDMAVIIAVDDITADIMVDTGVIAATAQVPLSLALLLAV